MKWFSINGIVTEAKRVRWPKGKDLFNNTLICVGFIAFLALFFFLCSLVSSGFLKAFGI